MYHRRTPFRELHDFWLGRLRKLWWDDWTAIAAMIQITEERFYKFSAKVSICCFYIRVFVTRRFHHAALALIVFFAVHAIIFLFLVIFQCMPINATWDKEIQGQCLDVSAIGNGGAALSIIEDFTLVILPIPELMKLQLTRKRKLAVGLLFAVGSFACIASMVRLKFLVSYSPSYDPTYDYQEIVLWSAIESSTAITCGSLPALRPLFRRFSGILNTLKDRLQAGHRKEPNASFVTVKAIHSFNSSKETSPKYPPQRPRLLVPFDASGASKDVTTTMGMIDQGEKDGLELEDWDKERRES
ncbi:integral membrane protein [Colletotrichum salicis]|uniref:Integral membrane protein n=1 Tax=Colletotrichum salicis TaxID=1209931 RepID=A0A135V6B7_9PEZI|nr:integral membrane protein [Colletotrichum salicis]